MLLENDSRFTFGAYLSIIAFHKLQLVSVLIVSDQDLVTDFHIVKERIDPRTNSIKSVVKRYRADRLHGYGRRGRLVCLWLVVEPGRIELPTSCVQGRRSPS